MHTTASRDATTIAYDREGDGDPLILVPGAFSYRRYPGQVKLAGLLAARFTVYSYDRRGRGDSGDTKPYAVEREIEDLSAVINAAGGHAHVWGLSSGAVLALQAAAAGLPIRRLAVHEPPLVVDPGDWQPPGRPAPAGHRPDRRWPARRGGPLLHGGRHGRARLRPHDAAPHAEDMEGAHGRRAHPAV